MPEHPQPRADARETSLLQRALEEAEAHRDLAEGILALTLCRAEQEIFDALMVRAEKILPSAHWAIGKLSDVHEGRQEFELQAWTQSMHAQLGDVLVGLRLPIMATDFSRKIYFEHQIVLVDDCPNHPDQFDPLAAQRFGLRSILGVPLAQSGNLVGVLYCVAFLGEPALAVSDFQARGLQNLCRITALALDRQRTQAALQRQLDSASRLNARLRIFQASLAEVAAQPDLERALRGLLDTLADPGGYPKWAIHRAVPGPDGTRELHTLVQTGAPGLLFTPADPLPIGGPGASLSGRAAASGETTIIEDLLADPGSKEHQARAHAFGVRSGLSVPLRGRDGTLFGVLTGYGERPGRPSPELLSQAAAAADLATLAIERFQLWEALQGELAQRKESEELYRTLVEEGLTGVYLIQDGAFQYGNPAFRRIFGYTQAELKGMPVGNLVAPVDRETVLNNIRKRVSGQIESIHYTFLAQGKGGREIPVEVHGSTVQLNGRPAVLGVLMDVSEQQKAARERETLERQLFQAQKMESLGVMAGGVAHDFNNLLTGILGHADLAIGAAGEPPALLKHLGSLRATALRAAELTRQLLAYSGKGVFELRRVDLSALVEDTVRLLDVSVPKAVSVRLDLGRGLPAIQGDAAQLRQVLMNLVINAAESMEGTEGTVRVTTAAETLEGTALEGLHGAAAKPGPHVILRVADTGSGMDEATLGRIFEPFFTTKFTGRGLGLPAILGIVRGHGASLRVKSSPGEGSVFTVCFPTVPGAAEPEPEAAPQAARGPNGNGLILVADDDPGVRAVARQTLELRGYRVVEAEDGAQALDHVRLRGGAISLVVLDATMPNMSGESTLRELQDLRPSLPVLLSSGYDEQATLQRFPGLGLADFLPKPYGPRDLLAKVQALLAKA